SASLLTACPSPTRSRPSPSKAMSYDPPQSSAPAARYTRKPGGSSMRSSTNSSASSDARAVAQARTTQTAANEKRKRAKRRRRMGSLRFRESEDNPRRLQRGEEELTAENGMGAHRRGRQGSSPQRT